MLLGVLAPVAGGNGQGLFSSELSHSFCKNDAHVVQHYVCF